MALPEKRDLRIELRATLAQLTRDEIDARSRKACHRFFEQPAYIKAEVVMVYLSLPSEVDTTPLVLRCWQDHKRVLVPRVSWEQRRMLPIEIRSMADASSTSDLGVREPASGVPFPIGLIDMVVVPGLGYDEYGNRLGRGRGFYDRFLAHPEFKGTSCGLAFEVQVIPRVPVGPLDRPVNMLITDESCRRFIA